MEPGLRIGFEPMLTPPQGVVLPLHYRKRFYLPLKRKKATQGRLSHLCEQDYPATTKLPPPDHNDGWKVRLAYFA